MTPTSDQLEQLARLGVDDVRLQAWRRGIADGSISKEHNCVDGPLQPPPADTIVELPHRSDDRYQALAAMGRATIAENQLGVVILNGGMATRFGGVVKGIVDVLGPGRSFLALKAADLRRAEQECGGTVQLFVMNSFATDAATRAHFAEHRNFGLRPDQVHHFVQDVSVRLTADGELFRLASGELSPYGTGHGDFAECVRKSGTLERFLAGGGRVLFVSNVDNLGARIDPAILGMHVVSRAEMTVEVAPKWPGDVGGSPFVWEDRIQLIEQIRYPDGFDADVVDVFNTNTFHFAAKALDRDLPLTYYCVEKAVDDAPAIQFERLIGELTRHLRTQFLKVKRSGRANRFLPVKTPDDLNAARDEIGSLYSG